MVTTRKCGTCCAVLPEGAPMGQCPECLLQLGLDAAMEDGPNSTRESRLSMRLYFGDFELLEEIARGGMGVVYKARQLSLNRTVAVKMILAGHFAGSESVQRFRAEAEAAASLRHPNIVAIHEIGEHEGRQYFSMDYIDGLNLAEAVRDKPMSPRRAAACIQTIAEAIQYAHERGILHRDLKPSNVLLDSFDAPHITDFGLAKRFGVPPSGGAASDGSSARGSSDAKPAEARTPNSDLTLSGQVLGSPNYMPPEQASGKRGHVGPRSDVYSLGAILQHLLTARAPFAAGSVTDTLQQVLHSEPVSPRVLNPSVPVDLETICLKCLQKEQARRYATAGELAEELGRFLRGEPILARPVGVADKTWRWCRRKPALATSLFLGVLLVLVLGIGAPITVLRTNRARAEAEQERSKAERNEYAANMKLASQAVRDGAVGYARELLMRHCPKPGAADLRGFEWRYLWRATRQGEVVQTLAGLPWWVDVPANPKLERVGDTLYNVVSRRNELRSGSELRAWNMTNWTPLELRLPSHPAFDRWFWHPYQKTALAVDNTNHTLTVYRMPDFQKGQVIPLRGLVTYSAISPDRRLLAVCFQDGDKQQVSVWDLLANAERPVLAEYSARVVQLEFSSDGKILAVACADGAIGLWDLTTSKPLPGPRKSEPFEPFVRFAPSGSRLFFENPPNVLQMWDPVAGASSSLVDQGFLGGYEFSPDGELLAVAWSNIVWLFDAKSNRRVGALRGHQSSVTALAFSLNGKLVATAGMDRTARLWDFKTERELATLGGHDDTVYGVAFSEDGGWIVTCSANGAAKVWDVPEVLGRNFLLGNSTRNWWLRMSADERLLASADNEGTIHIWDRLNRTLLHSIRTGSPNEFVGLTFEAQGNRLAWASRTTLGLFDLRSGRSNTIPIEGNQGLLEGISFSPDDQEIMFGSRTNVMVCELATMQLRPFARCEEEVSSIAYSPEGLLAFGHQGGVVSLWDRKSGRMLSTKQAQLGPTPTVEFSRDGKWLASCGGLIIQLWRVHHDGLTPSKTLRGHAGYVPSIAFSPDGTRLVSASSDFTLKLWDTAEGIEIGTLYGHRGYATGVTFTKDGRRIYSTGQDGDVRVWEAPPLAEIDSPTKSAP